MTTLLLPIRIFWILLPVFVSISCLVPCLHAQNFPPVYNLSHTPGSSADAVDMLIRGGQTTDFLGSGVCTGDINGDGVDDLIVAAYGDTVGTPARSRAGSVNVWFGGAALTGLKDLATTAPNLTILGSPTSGGLTAGTAGLAAAMLVADVNGDGKKDLILGAPYGDGPGNGRNNAGEAYIIFGRAVFPATLDLAAQGSAGADVTIYGATGVGGDFGDKLTANRALTAGDVNGDGIADLILGAPEGAGPGDALPYAGEVYFIFGRSSFPSTLDLRLQGNAGANVTVYGPDAGAELGARGAIVTGDVNGDGTADVIVGAPGGYGPANSREFAGQAYIIFGRKGPATFPATLDLALQGNSGASVTIYGASANDHLTGTQEGGPLLRIADVNADSIPDVILGSMEADGPAEARNLCGEAYIVFGRNSFPATLDLAVQGNTGANVTIYGAAAEDTLGHGGALATGDVNGDGAADLILGAMGADGPQEARPLSGEAYIVFGRKSPATFPATLDLGVQGAAGASVTIYGAESNDLLTQLGAIATGDLNSDGAADLILGAPWKHGPGGGLGGPYGGVGYIVSGRKSPATFPAILDLSEQGDAGAEATIYGAGSEDYLMSDRAFAIGDITGDGALDLILGAYQNDGVSQSRPNSGAAYVIRGLPPQPEIIVEAPAGTSLYVGTRIFFGRVSAGQSSAPKIFTISNAGAAPLNITGVSVTGEDAAEFAVSTAGMLTTVPAGAQTTFRVTFNAASSDPAFTTLRITSNDSDEGVTGIRLVGNVVADIQPLVLNEQFSGLIETTVSEDHWTFAAAAGRQVRFDLLNASVPGLTFTLRGPNGFISFENLTDDSELITLPEDGTYTLYVTSDGTASNAAYAFRMESTDITDLVLDTPATVNLTGSRQAELFRLDFTTPGTLHMAVTNSGSGNRLALYLRRGLPPTRSVSDYQAVTGLSGNRSIAVPAAPPGVWYALVYADYVPAPGTFTIEATSPNLTVAAALPRENFTGLTSRVTITGAGFQPGTVVELVSGGNMLATATTVVDSFTQLTASFPANAVPLGAYDLRVRRPDGATTVVAGGFAMVNGTPKLETGLIIPHALGRHAVATLYVQYANIGTAPMPAPLLIIKSADPDQNDRPIFSLDQSAIIKNFWSGQGSYPPGTAPEALILASGAQPGVLGVGERRTIPVYYIGLLQPWDFNDNTTEIEIRYWTADDTTPIDWSARKAALKPSTLDAATWDIVYANATAGLHTNAAYVQMLTENARRLAGLGQNVTDVSALWQFELMQASGLSPLPVLDSPLDASVTVPGTPLELSRRFTSNVRSRQETGPFGRGWFTSWQTRLTVENGGDVVMIIGEAGSAAVYTRDTRDPLHARFFSPPGDPNKLSAVTGGYELRTPDGHLTRFASGRIAYLEDANGNRVTAGYNGPGQLITLNHTSGASISLGYTGPHITSVTESSGRTVTHAYSGDYLTSTTTGDGKVTAYTYDAAGTPSKRHTLTSITRGGVTHTFTWDANGRLASTFTGAGEELLTFAYDTAGGVSVTQGTGTTNLFYDHRGLIAKAVDALGNISTIEYDGNGRPARMVFPTGESRRFTWCDWGSPASITDELGGTTRFTYDHPLKRLTALTDAKDFRTTFTCDPKGNLTDTTFPDNTVTRFSDYTAAGLPQTRTNRRSQPVTFTYTAAGQVDRRTLPDGSDAVFDYDARGNLVTVTEHPAGGPGKVTAYTFDTATHGDRLRKITNPGGSWVEYSYDANGRRQRMADSTGGETRYEYDTAGRLAKLRDSTNALLAEYLYDSAGRMERMNKGNGTCTTWSYDPAGQLLNVTNFAPGGAPNSKFDYTYDTRGRRRTMTTLDGAWTYTYDATGQLVTANFASSNASIPNRSLSYTYDSLGNRTHSTTDSIFTGWVSNSLNQYTSIGGTAQTYDSDGNLTDDGMRSFVYDDLSRLTQVTGPEGVTQYEYDALGNRTATILNGQRTDFLLDVTGTVDVIAEVPATGAARHLVRGHGLVSRGATGATAYYDFDGIGSTAALTGSAGAVLNRYVFEPFGGTMFSSGSTPNPFQFVGQLGVQRETTGTHFMRARFYTETGGRFTQEDPIRLMGADVNLHRYTANDPVNFFDPLGTITFSGVVDTVVSIGNFNPGGHFSVFKAVGTIGTINQFITVVQGIALTLEGVTWSSPLGFSFAAGGLFGKFLLQMFPKLGTFFGDWLYDKLHPAPSGPGTPGGSGRPDSPSSFDPNDKSGPGAGTQGWVTAGALLPYRINFENLGPGSRKANGDPFPAFATAPAHRVTITDQLDPGLDWSTFEVTDLGFGDTIVPVGNQSNFTATVPMTFNGQIFNVEMEAGIDVATGRVCAVFQSIDPATSLPPDVLTGFLPPEDGTGTGKGHFSFVVRAKANLTTGTQIRNVADIRFDINDVIRTDQIDPQNPAAGNDPAKQALVTLDAHIPVSTVAALPASSASDFTVNWSGSDAGSGIAGYDVYVSDNSGAWTLWQSGTTATSAIFHGTAGHTYGFFSVARDIAGNLQPSPVSAQTATTVGSVIQPKLEFLSGSTPARLSLRISGSSGQVFTLKSSTDLTNWTNLQTITLSGATSDIELQTPNPPRVRFFRLE